MIGNESYFMRMALTQAKEAMDHEEVPIGCVISYKDQIIARSYNQVEKLNDPTAHAEMIAITSATQTVGSKYLDQCDIYITLEPCMMCAGAIHWARLGKVIYGASDPKKGFSLVSPPVLLGKVEIIKGVLEEECQLLLNRFFMKKR